MAITEPREWFERELTEKVSADPGKVAGFSGTLEIDISGETGGVWTVTIADGNVAVKEGKDPAARFKIEMKDNHFVDMMNGRLSAQKAFMTRKLKFHGNVTMAMKLRPLLF